MPRYDFAAIEARWQKTWLEEKTFRTPNPGDADFNPSRPKRYILDMFPYPSGAGLHVGHPKGYTATDAYARFLRMRGFQVLHPMGWDAFGLPAEQYAIETGTHPAETTAKNVSMYRRQLQSLGFSYDWDREVNTTDPSYYRWTQWIFSKLYERGLAYQAEIPVWWCEELGTVLANEEVIDGYSERGNYPCVKRPLRQWMLRITEYAERLLTDLEDLDWPDSVKAMQREWIGRSEGAEVRFALADHPEEFTVFTTRPDTLFGATFCVLSPEHPLLARITTPTQQAAVKAYCAEAAGKSDLERAELQKEKTGVFTGAYALNPVFEEGDPRRRVPVWVADYVLMSYGTGSIMCVPGGDERDHAFATRFELPIVQVVSPPEPDEAAGGCWAGEGVMAHSDWLDGMPSAEAKQAMIAWLEERGLGTAKVTYRLRDWLFSRQRYWGEPFPLLHDEESGEISLVAEQDLPVTLPELEDYAPASDGRPPLAKAEAWCRVEAPSGKVWRRETNSMPQWAGSCWYYLRYLDPSNDQAAWSREAENYWMPVDLYVGGAEHAVLHLLYARFWHKVLHDAGLVSTSEPFQRLINQGMIQAYAFRDERGALVPSNEVEEVEDGVWQRKLDAAPVAREVGKMSKSLRNVVTPDEVIDAYGADTMRLYEMFLGPLTASAPWNPRDLPGVHRFLQRAWRLLVPEEDDGEAIRPNLREDGESDAGVERALHAAISKVTRDLESLAFNTAIAAMMEFVNVATKANRLERSQAERFVLLLSPFAPHLAEELWSRLGHSGSLAYQPWPVWEESLLQDAQVELPVQINGKVRGRVSVSPDALDATVEAAAREVVADQLAGASVKKVVVVPGRMVSFVIAKAGADA